jgi:hypothetical protein
MQLPSGGQIPGVVRGEPPTSCYSCDSVRISPILRWSHDLAAAGLPKWQVVSLRLDRQHRGLLCVACECQLPTAKAARLTTCIWRRRARLHMHKHISPSMADCMSLTQARIFPGAHSGGV